MNRPLVLALTGASGAAYAMRLLEVLLKSDREVYLTISPSGRDVLQQELGLRVDLDQFDPGCFSSASVRPGQLRYFHYQDFLAPIASGSHLTGGMVICPCSGSTLSAIAHAGGNNLIHRAADVHLKEGRRLVLVPRETPLSLLQLKNMQRACQAGAIILPAAPGWYHGVDSLQDLIDFVVARILDQLGVPHELMKRWGDTG
jgi:4-hydroxy-3-polyprenylbenzoate decarboxylase